MSYTFPSPEHLLLYRPLVRRLSRVAVRGGDEAEEVEQRVWLRILEHPPRHGNGLAAWLQSVVRSVASHMREGERHRTAREQDYGERPTRAWSAAELERVHERDGLLETLDRIAPEKAAVLRLRFLEGRAPSEIAGMLGLPVETVRTRIKRGLRQVRARISPG